MKSLRIIVPLIILSLISFIFDKQLIALQGLIKNNFLDYIFVAIDFLANGIIVSIFLTLLFVLTKKKKIIIPFWLSIFLTSIMTLILKVLILRPRPCQVFAISDVCNFSSWNSSFPSWHASLIFTTLPLVILKFPKFGIYWIIFAILAVFARFYLGVHYLSDILAGVVLGYLIATLVLRYYDVKH